MKISFFDAKPYDTESFEKYKSEDLEFKFFESRLTKDSAPLAKGSDAVCIFVNDVLDAEVIDILNSFGIKIALLRCAGYNNVDLSHAFGKIHVSHVPRYSPYAVAEHAMAMLLTSVRRIHKAYNRTRDFNFSLSGLTGFDLHGKTVGIVGMGKIGEVFAEICKGFGMKILAYDKFPKEKEGVEYLPLDELFKSSDIISLHCPLTEESFHMINKEALAQMKKGVIIINTSRGALIDAEALVESIKERKTGAACLDVYEEESDIFFKDYSGHIMDDDTLARLIGMPNVLLTSHQAFLTEEALDNIAKTTVESFYSLYENGCSENELCYGCGSTDSCRRSRKSKCF